jgi:hypothetical protein
LDGATSSDYCQECNQSRLFVAASTTDYCLKQIGTSYTREVCTNAATGAGTLVDGTGYTSFVGTYSSAGYYSVIVSGPSKMGIDDIKHLKRVMLEVSATDQVTPCVLLLRIGYSYNAYDPLNGFNADPNNAQNASTGCGIIWKTYARKLLGCNMSDDPAAMLAANLSPNQMGQNWPVLVEGRYIYWSIVIASLEDDEDLESDLVPAVGGESCYSNISFRSRTAQRAMF